MKLTLNQVEIALVLAKARSAAETPSLNASGHPFGSSDYSTTLEHRALAGYLGSFSPAAIAEIVALALIGRPGGGYEPSTFDDVSRQCPYEDATGSLVAMMPLDKYLEEGLKLLSDRFKE